MLYVYMTLVSYGYSFVTKAKYHTELFLCTSDICLIHIILALSQIDISDVTR